MNKEELATKAIEILRELNYTCSFCTGNPMVNQHNKMCETIRDFQEKLAEQELDLTNY